jgi:hypothetical protein
MYGGKKDFDFEAPLTHLVWITSAVSIGVTFVASNVLLGDFRRVWIRTCGGCSRHHQLRDGGRAR